MIDRPIVVAARTRPPSKLVSIQYLRGIAAILVVCYHASSGGWFAFGNSGVDVFFVISGFIMWTMTSGRSMPPLVFLQRRIQRIVPLYWGFTLLLVTADLVAPWAFPMLKFSAPELAASLTFIPYLNGSNGTARPILQQGWTLNREMLFYVIVAAALLCRQSIRLAVVAGMLTLLVVVGVVTSPTTAIGSAMTDPMMIEFLFGIGIATLAKRQRLPSASAAVTILLFAAVGFLATASGAAEVPSLRPLSWGIPSMLLVLGLLTLEQKSKFPHNALLLLVGNASYSIYLSHTFVISLMHKGFAVLHVSPAAANSVWAFVATVSACGLGGIFVYATIEVPLLAHASRRTLLERPA